MPDPAVISVGNRAALKAVAASIAPVVELANEGARSGTFIWTAGNFSSQIVVDTLEGIFIAPTADVTGASGVWVRESMPYVLPECFGAAGDGLTSNDTAAVQCALNVAAIAKLFSQRVVISQKYLCDNLAIPAGVVLEGSNPALRDLVPGSSPYSFNSQIRLRLGATISLARSSVIRSMAIVRDGLLASVTTDANATTITSQFAGTAITMPERDAEAHDILLLGHNLGINSTAANGDEGWPVIENI